MNHDFATSVVRPVSRRGFSLVESVVVMSVCATILLLVAATLWGTMKIERADSAALNRVTVQADLADQFRADVGESLGCLDALGEFRAEPTCLILKLADDRQVVYRWSDERLKRTEIAGGEVTTRPIAVGGERIDVRFGRSADGRVVSLRLVESRGSAKSRRDWPLEFSAALGGNRR